MASRAEVAEARSAFDEVKGMLEESSSERERLGEELTQLKGQWQQAKDEAAKYKHEVNCMGIRHGLGAVTLLSSALAVAFCLKVPSPFCVSISGSGSGLDWALGYSKMLPETVECRLLAGLQS